VCLLSQSERSDLRCERSRPSYSLHRQSSLGRVLWQHPRMILRLSNPAARIALSFVAVALAAVLAYSSVRNALAENAIRLGTRAGYERSVKLEADNPVNWYLLGRYWQYNLEEIDNLRAIEAYRTALSLDPRSADSWLDLASAYEVQNDTSAASDAYQQAK